MGVNGMPLAAICGPAKYMQYASHVSGTFGGECLSLAAAGATLAVYQREPVIKTMWETARLEKKLERYAAALAVYTDLVASKNPYRVMALEELAKHYERRERNYPKALELTRSSLALEDSEPMRRREQRLKDRLARRPGRPITSSARGRGSGPTSRGSPS